MDSFILKLAVMRIKQETGKEELSLVNDVLPYVMLNRDALEKELDSAKLFKHDIVKEELKKKMNEISVLLELL